MPITNLPTFRALQLLLAAQLNQLTQAIQTWSSSVSGADIAWPLIADGDLDFDNNTDNGIIGLTSFWNIYNADTYSSVQAAIDAAESAIYGACVFVPANTTLEVDGLTVQGSNITIMGAGPSSTLKLTAANTLLNIGQAGTAYSNINIMNLTLDGNSKAAKGIVARRITRLCIDNVRFKDFNDDFLYLTNDGTATNSCAQGIVSNCWFDDGASSADHITGDDVSQFVFSNIHSDTAAGNAINLTAAAGCNLSDITLSNIHVDSPTVQGIVIKGASTFNDLWSRITLSNCQVFNAANDDAFQLGATGAQLKYLMVENCKAWATIGADAFVVQAQYGKISGCYAYGATEDGLDMTSSEYLTVTGNDFQSAGAIGIDATSTDYCSITGNNVLGFTTEGVTKDSATNLSLGGNLGDKGPTPGDAYSADPDLTVTGTTDTTEFGLDYTIPANTVQIGDTIRIMGAFNRTNTNAATDCRAKIGGVDFNGIVCETSAQIYICVELIVDALSGADSTRYSLRALSNDSGTAPKVVTGTKTIDWTADVEVDFTADPGNSSDQMHLRHVVVEYIGGSAA